MISHLGPQLGIADGIALAQKIDQTNKSTLVFSGDGGASEGDFHEALNVAAVWGLPVIFIVENNQWGLSTPSSEQFNCKQFTDKGIGYGMEAIQVDGNNILEVFHAIKEIKKKQKNNPRPFLVEAMSFRMRGHEEASGTKYYPEGLQEKWALKDPITNFESFLIESDVLTIKETDQIKSSLKKEINEHWSKAFAAPNIEADVKVECGDIYKQFERKNHLIDKSNSKSIRFIDAISEGLKQSMEKFPESVIMGQDIAEYGGVFKITEGFVELFGKERVRNTPICESSIIEIAMGLSICNRKSIVELQFSDFITSGFNPVVNYLAKVHYRWGQNADVVLRMPCGAGVGAGPFHSQTNEAWFTKTPGLIVVYPAFPDDAKGLLISSIENPNPVLFFEHKALYRSIRGKVPEGYYNIEIGKAKLLRVGNDITVITYGAGVHEAINVVDKNSISCDLIDLRTLSPLDSDSIINSVNKTGKAIILHEDSLFGGLGSEISSIIMENCFENLDAPVIRVGSLNTPIPFEDSLEKQYLPYDRFEKEIKVLLNY